MDLQTLDVNSQYESRGDEYYIVTYKLRGRLGEGDRIYFFDYGDQVSPIVAGNNWAQRGREYSIPQGAGRLTFDNLAPFEVYGFVALLKEANANTVEEQTNAFGFGEFQNEAGVTQTVSSAFARAVPRDVSAPDYSDTSCRNVEDITTTVRTGLLQHFGDYTNTTSGLPKAIRDVTAVPLDRGNPDRLDGVIWSFFMNIPGGARGLACVQSAGTAIFPWPNTFMFLRGHYVNVTGEHRQ